MKNPFQPVEKYQAPLRLALYGLPGTGKTYTALKFATSLLEKKGKSDGVVYLVDTENGSSARYKREFPNFHILNVGPGATDTEGNPSPYQDYNPEIIPEILSLAEQYADILIVDSLSHFWDQKGGVHDIVDSGKSKNTFANWKLGKSAHRYLSEAILMANLDFIGTIRAKPDYRQEGREIVLAGNKPIQDSSLGYNFDIIAEMEVGNVLRIEKSRCSDFVYGQTFSQPTGDEIMPVLLDWLDGKPDPFIYGDGEKVKVNATVRQFFLKYLEENAKIPTSADELKEWAKANA